MTTSGTGAFPGFGPGAFAFFADLASNQSKSWFEDNRTRYETDVRGPAVILAGEVGAALARAGLPLGGDAKRSMFRINRDLRFSNDKSPYKTHAGMVWMRPGFKKASPGILYLHVAPETCFMATGFYGLDRPVLDTVRAAIRDDDEAWTAAVAKGSEAGLALDLSDTMTRLPRGFEGVADPALASAVKARNLVLKRPLTAKAVGRPDLVGTLVAAVQVSLPLLQFGWDAIAEHGPAPEWSRMN